MTNDEPTRKAMVWGWFLLAAFLPLGLTLEALHALKVPVYLESSMRREMWTLAHAHGNLLGLLCLAFAALGERSIRDAAARASISFWLRLGAVLMPVGFFLGGILNAEGDPSLAIVLTPLGGLCLLFALLRAALSAHRSKV
jgi:hypothetical protein